MITPKTPILILHGWSLSGIKFDPLTNVLKEHHWKVFAPTMPGFVDGVELTKPYTLDDYVSFIVHYCTQEHIESAIVIGHSFGGRVAIKLAAYYPEKVKALVLTGTPGYSSAPWYKLWAAIFLAKVGKLLFATPFLLPAQDAVRSFYYYIIGVKDYTKSNKVMRVTFKNVVAESLREPMEKIKAPTMLVWGNQDQLVPVSIARRMLKVINGSTLKTIGFANHGVPFNKPKEFYTACFDFLDSVMSE